MSYGSSVYGAASYGAGEDVTILVQPSVTLEIQVEAGLVRPRAYIEQRISTKTTVSALTIEQQIVAPFFIGTGAAMLKNIYVPEAPSITIEQRIFNKSSRDNIWSPVVTIAGRDYSDRLTGALSITHEENSSGLATFQIVPESGSIDLLGYVGNKVFIDYKEQNSAGAESLLTRRFTGIISVPRFIPDTGVLEFKCTTDLQGRVSTMTRGEIDSIVSGYWSEHVFDKDADPWRYANDQLSTVPASLWIDTGGFLRVTNWAAGSADYTYTEADRIADTVSVSRADKAAIRNHVGITMDFRYSRQMQRNIVYRWEWPGTLCDYLKDTFKLPQRQQVTSAIEGSGWEQIGTTKFTPVWPGQVIDCTETSAPAGTKDYRVWSLDWLGGESEGLDQLCIGATFTLSKRWSKTITETYTLDVQAPKSISVNGDLAIAEAYGVQAETSDETWEQDTGFTRTADSITGNARIGGLALTMPTGSVELDNGDWVYPAVDAETTGRDAMENAQEVCLNKAKTEILGGHRENRVNFTCRLDPLIDLSHTARLNITRIQATGKVYAVTDRMDLETGSATTSITLAISDAGATGTVTETPLDPVEATVDYTLTEYDLTHWLSYYIGGRITSAAYDDTDEGYFSNYEFDSDNLDPFNSKPADAEFYPEQFAINTPEITTADRQAETAEAAQVFEIDIPNDELVEIM